MPEISIILFFVTTGVILILIILLVFEKIRRESIANKTKADFAKQTVSLIEDEKNIVAMEIHDSVQAKLSNISRLLSTLESENFHATVEIVRSILEKTIRELKFLSYNLKPAQLENSTLKKSIELMLIEGCLNNNIEIDLDIKNFEVENEIQLNVYRIIQEAFNNVLSHANARKMWVSIYVDNGNIIGSIKDDGIGFNKETMISKSLGLKNMKERAKMMGGLILINSSVGEGTEVLFKLPSRIFTNK